MCGNSCMHMKKCQAGLVISSAIVVILSGISIPLIQVFIHHELQKNLMLVDGSMMYDMWIDPPIPVYVECYMFDIQNPAQVIAGGKPIVKEKGPYTYQILLDKVDIVPNDNGTVTYRQIKTYEFIRNMSIGSDEDNITTLNLPLVAISHLVKYKDPLWKDLAALIELFTKTIFQPIGIRDLVFGYHEPLLTLAMKLDPERFTTDLLGLLAGLNATDDGVYTVFTGQNDLSKLGIIDKYNGSREMNHWTSKLANMVNGSDGSLVPPYVQKDQLVYVFSTGICRSLVYQYHNTTSSVEGVGVYRFTATRDLFADPSENPYNAGFCTPAGDCMGTGVLNLTMCKTLDTFRMPMMASFPHFLMADQRYIDAIEGMNPEPDKHNTIIDVEPTSGVIFNEANKLQLNLYVEPLKEISSMKKLRTMVYPLMWINVVVRMDDDNAIRLKTLLAPIRIVSILQYTMAGVGSITFLCGLKWLLVARQRRKKKELCIQQNKDAPDDRSPLLS